MDDNQKTFKIPYLRKLGYASGNMGFGVVFQVVISYLFLYATGVQKIAPGMIGAVASASVIWDAVTDPVMGYISDHTNSKRFGRRHLYLLIGGGSAALFNYLLWIVDPALDNRIKVVWILAAIFLIKSALTVYSTPHSALGAELSDDYDERSSIQGMRTIFFLLALLTVLVIFMAVFFKATPEYPQGQLNPEAYPRMGLTASALMAASCVITYVSTKKYIPYLQKLQPVHGRNAGGVFLKILNEYKTAFTNKSFVFVVLSYMFTNITTALFSVVGMHVYTYTFRFNNVTIGILFGTQILVSVASQSIWVALSKRIDKKPSVILGLILCMLCCVTMGALVLINPRYTIDISVFIVLSAVLGFGSGVLFSMPMSMIADTIDLEELTTGKRSEGVYYGLLTLCYKLSQSVVLLVVGFLLEAIGFNADLSVQTQATAKGLGMILVTGSLIALILAVLSISRYRLNRSEIRKVQEKLAAEKAAADI